MAVSQKALVEVLSGDKLGPIIGQCRGLSYEEIARYILNGLEEKGVAEVVEAVHEAISYCRQREPEPYDPPRDEFTEGLKLLVHPIAEYALIRNPKLVSSYVLAEVAPGRKELYGIPVERLLPSLPGTWKLVNKYGATLKHGAVIEIIA